MFILFLISCFLPHEECNQTFPCEKGITCKVCCEIGGENCITRCSDGWTDIIPPAATEADLKNDICHCVPSVEECL